MGSHATDFNNCKLGHTSHCTEPSALIKFWCSQWRWLWCPRKLQAAGCSLAAQAQALGAGRSSGHQCHSLIFMREKLWILSWWYRSIVRTESLTVYSGSEVQNQFYLLQWCVNCMRKDIAQLSDSLSSLVTICACSCKYTYFTREGRGWERLFKLSFETTLK